ncbi:MAG: hypothetical protein ACOCP4_02705 [Candidatus Woesearchaeota archaeon]
MKKDFGKNIELKCLSCGTSKFEYNEDKTWAKCNKCGRTFEGGYDQLVKLNQENLDKVLDKKTKKELKNYAEKEFKEMLKKATRGNKNIRLK